MAQRRKTTSEGGLASMTRRQELAELRGQQVALRQDLEQAEHEVKRLRAELKGVEGKLYWCVDNFDQPDLPFPEADGNGHTGNGEWTPGGAT